MTDKETYPDPGSDAMSLVTLNPEDMNRFKVPSFAPPFRDYIYSSLAKWITDSAGFFMIMLVTQNK